MTPHPALTAAFARRLPALEPLRRRVRSTVRLQAAGYVVLGAFFLALLAGGAVGTMWFIGNHVTQNLFVVFGAALAVVVLVVVLAIVAFRRFSRWRGDAQDRYVAAFRNQVVIPALRDFLPGTRVSADATLGVDTFRASGLFDPRHDRFSAAYTFEGEVDGVRYVGSTLRAWKYVADVRHERKEDVTYFKGVFFHLQRPVAWPGTVRLVVRETYAAGAAGDIRVVRRGGTVQVRDGVEAFDPEAALLLDEGVDKPPAIPEQVFRHWVGLRQLLGKPVFVSFNARGVYLAVAVAQSQRWPLEDRLHTANRAEELAEDAELMQRVLRAVELLRRMFP